MAATKFLLLLVVLVFSLSSKSSVGTEKVSLDLYYESLCPYSARFFVNYLDDLFSNGLIDIVDLRLIPYGNARVGSNNTISCQHGPYECLLNTVEACVIDVWPNVGEHFPFINCIETLVADHKYLDWQSCFVKAFSGFQRVADCYNSGYGKKLELQYAAETNALQPPHTYVPWVVVDGQPLYKDYENVGAYVCKAYKGSLPPACNSAAVLTSASLLSTVNHQKKHVTDAGEEAAIAIPTEPEGHWKFVT
ncbi:gamma-interferon-inducible lysosomal thiol reductase [Amborella trichopoda]|uniref:Gamma-interferon-inducible lysosomal thiol reductase n=1 Tax=Amborella trichopoda TaxID=13333 RepID=W1PMR4_AMBTC|nr:gamma-interferon-inducible lysosomal thiol reductase [Amborella trichopoda]ERN08996.1 hypothetical protein AMTR_s00153p00061670 [Amborella trichopoda]|eukprot:XP_006847415.1 gamma-interferon-inducible lysosomal thiol reductase [Amborella trichopoda]